MKTRQTALAIFSLFGAALFGCAGNSVTDVRQDVVKAAIEVKNSPEAPVQRTITNFDDALVCMDMLLIDNGIRDVVVLTEDLVDNTKRANVGTRDMLISSVSDMTRRSRAIRLVTFGSDVKNLQDWLKNSGGHQNVYNFQPEYNIRGSLTQMDEGLASGQVALNAQLGPISGGKQGGATTALVGLDLSIMSTKTMELLPGVTSRNSVMLQRSSESSNVGVSVGGQQQQGQQQPQPQPAAGGGAMQGTMDNKTFGISYNFSVNRSEGVGGGVRNLVELASVELFGKLLRIPYWQCLGVPSSHPMVKREIGDWYFNLVEEGKLVKYMQNQLRIMGRYNGPVDGKPNREFGESLKSLAAANKMPPPQTVDEQMFSLIVNLPNKNVKRSSKQLAFLSDDEILKKFAVKSIPKQPGTKVATRSINLAEESSWRPIGVEFTGTSLAKKPRIGDPLSLTVKTNQDAYLYCYLTSEKDRSTMRIFPNPVNSDPWVGANQEVVVPGDPSIGIKVTGTLDSVACFASDNDPALSVGRDHVGAIEMQKRTLNMIRASIGTSADARFGEARFVINRR
ncbi:MAG: DUF4384 domain-containing protein [Burkholderiales bacterium]